MTQIHPRTVYSSLEARTLLGLSQSTFRLLVKRGQIKGRKAGRVWRFLGSELLKFMEGETTPSTQEPQ